MKKSLESDSCYLTNLRLFKFKLKFLSGFELKLSTFVKKKKVSKNV